MKYKKIIAIGSALLLMGSLALAGVLDQSITATTEAYVELGITLVDGSMAFGSFIPNDPVIALESRALGETNYLSNDSQVPMDVDIRGSTYADKVGGGGQWTLISSAENCVLTLLDTYALSSRWNDVSVSCFDNVYSSYTTLGDHESGEVDINFYIPTEVSSLGEYTFGVEFLAYATP